MRTRILGKDLQVSAVGFGCMGISHAYGEPMCRSDAINLLREAAEKGYTFFDTAAKRNTTTAQIALAWLIGKKPHIVPIPGTTKSERMKENAKAAEVWLTEKEISEIDAALNNMKMSAVFGGHKSTEGK